MCVLKFGCGPWCAVRERSRERRASGFGLIELVVVVMLLSIGVALLLPMLGRSRGPARQMQNNTQTRGIHQGMIVFAQGNKSGGGDGFFPGLNARGEAIALDGADTPENASTTIQADTFGNHNAIRGYDANANGDVDPEEMNDAATGAGFVQYAFAELLTGDFIPAGSSEYFLNPRDTGKAAFIAGDTGDAGHFDMSKVSYTIVNVAADQLDNEWKETINTQAMVLADRAVGDGNTFGTSHASASSVWTEEGSGDWRGALTRNDSSTETGTTYEAPSGLKYGNLTFVDGVLENMFARPDGEDLRMTEDGQIRSDQGVLFDQAERGRATGI
ncbi:MAG: type II secretion system protein [Planctomycetota bacterium]